MTMTMEMDATIPKHDVTFSKDYPENAYSNGPVNMNEHLSHADEKQVILDDVLPKRCHHCMGNESTFHREIEVNYMALKLDLVNSQSQNDYLVQAKNRADEKCQKMELQLRKALMHCAEIDSLHKALQHLQSNARSSALERTELRVHIESLEEQKDHYKNRNKLLERENLKLKAEQEECIRIIVDMRIELERFKGISQTRRISVSKHRPQDELHASSVSLVNNLNPEPETEPEDSIENQKVTAEILKNPFVKRNSIPKLEENDIDKNQQDISVSTDKSKNEHKLMEKNAREALRRWSMVTFGRPLTVLDRCIEENKCYHESFRSISFIDPMSPNKAEENQLTQEEEKQDTEDGNGNVFPNRVRKILPTRLRRMQSSNAMIGNQSHRNTKQYVGNLDDVDYSLSSPYDEKENKLIEKFLNISKYRHTATGRKSKNKVHIGVGSPKDDKKNYEPGYQNL